MIDSSGPRASRQTIERSIAFAQCNDIFFRKLRKKFAEAPNPALVESRAPVIADRNAPSEPQILQRRRISGRTGVLSARKNKLQQIAASSAAEILTRGIGSRAASDAAQTVHQLNLWNRRQGILIWSLSERQKIIALQT